MTENLKDHERFFAALRGEREEENLTEFFEAVGFEPPSEQEIYREMGLKGQPHELRDYLTMTGLPTETYSLKILPYMLVFPVIFAEGDYQFLLAHTDREIATVGFALKEREMEICQIQGRRGNPGRLSFSPRELLPSQWERKMVKVAGHWATDAGLEKIIISSAETQKSCIDSYNNPQRIESENLSGHQKRMRIRYNVTAERLGFTFDSKKGLYTLEL